MIKKTIAAACGALISISSANASPLNKWSGTWEKNTGSLVSVTVSNTGGALTVSAKGQCSPNPCDWGSVPAIAFSPSTATNVSGNTKAIIATFNQGFATKTLLLQGHSRDNLRYRVFTQFTDGSDRSNYTNNGTLKRKKFIVAQPVGTVILAKPFKEDCISFNSNAVSVAKKERVLETCSGQYVDA